MNLLRQHLFAPLFARREGLDYPRWLGILRRELEAAADPAERERLQIDRCSALLRHAYAHSPFYRDLFDRHGVRPQDFKDLRDLQRVPVFEKRMIPGNQERIRSSAVPAAELVASATGGTTGNCFAFWYDRACVARRQALTIIANGMLGWRIGDPAAYVWNAHQDLPGSVGWKYRLRNWLTRRVIYLEAAHIDEQGLAAWHEAMRRHRTEVMYGYAQSIRAIAAFQEATGRHLPDLRLVVTTAEPLYPADRVLLERAFGCDVRDRYASRESGPMAQQDDQGRMTIFANSVLLEVADEAGTVGDILVTDFWNRAFPFIRYRIGDTASLPPGQGAGLPVLGPLAGRQTDFLVAEDGARVSGMTFHGVFWDPARNDYGSDRFANIQFAQVQPREIEIRIVPGPAHEREADEVRLSAFVRGLLGQGMAVRFRYCDELPRTASGKYRFTVYEAPESR